MKHSIATDENKFSVYRAFDREKYQWYESEDSHALLLRKSCQYGEEDSKNKIMS